ncbi:MAG: hypothetical protein AAF191_11255 [Verrucomicrobiota bacterium]
MDLCPGQKYRLLDAEAHSTVTICQIDECPLGSVVHVRLDGLRLTLNESTGLSRTSIHHMAFTEDALHGSIGSLITEHEDPGNWEEAYHDWRVAFELGEAHVWQLPVFDALQIHEIFSGQNEDDEFLDD